MKSEIEPRINTDETRIKPNVMLDLVFHENSLLGCERDRCLSVFHPCASVAKRNFE
jgi:hypothetical protein